MDEQNNQITTPDGLEQQTPESMAPLVAEEITPLAVGSTQEITQPITENVEAVASNPAEMVQQVVQPPVQPTPVSAPTPPQNTGEWSTPPAAPPVQPIQAAPVSGSNPFESFKKFLMRWMPFFLMFDTFTSGVVLLSIGVPMLLFSLSTIWAMGIFYTLWSLFYLVFLVGEFVFLFVAFLAVYRRKQNAYILVKIANYVLIGSVVLSLLAGQGYSLTTLLNLIWPIVTLIAIDQYKRYFDPSVSGEKGLNLGDVPPSSSEKTIIYVLYSIMAGFLVVTMLILGLVMTFLSGAAGSLGIISSPFNIKAPTINTPSWSISNDNNYSSYQPSTQRSTSDSQSKETRLGSIAEIKKQLKLTTDANGNMLLWDKGYIEGGYLTSDYFILADSKYVPDIGLFSNTCAECDKVTDLVKESGKLQILFEGGLGSGERLKNFKVTKAGDRVYAITYRVEDDYGDVKEYLELAFDNDGYFNSHEVTYSVDKEHYSESVLNDYRGLVSDIVKSAKAAPNTSQ